MHILHNYFHNIHWNGPDHHNMWVAALWKWRHLCSFGVSMMHFHYCSSSTNDWFRRGKRARKIGDGILCGENINRSAVPGEFRIFTHFHSALWMTIMTEWFYLQVLVTCIYAFLVYSLTSQPIESAREIIFILMCVMSTLISYSIALLTVLQLSSKWIHLRVYVALAIIAPFVLLTGVWIPNIYILYITAYSYVRHAFEGKLQMQIIWFGIHYSCSKQTSNAGALIGIYGFGRYTNFTACVEDIYCDTDRPSDVVLRSLAIDEYNFSFNGIFLVTIFILLQALNVASLHWKIKSHRFTVAVKRGFLHVFSGILALCYVDTIISVFRYI